MKIYFIGIYRSDGPSTTVELCSKSDLSSFGFFYRTPALEFMRFFSHTIAERTEPNQRQQVEKQDTEYYGYVHKRSDQLSAVVVTDREYPQRVAFALISKLLDEFSESFPPQVWKGAKEGGIQFDALADYIAKYQDPTQADSIMKIHQTLDETQAVLHQTIEAVLKRGEKLDDLISWSNELSIQSKVFYSQAKKTNSCCSIM
ncbi:palmitoyltransferase [Spiromyces aspiralis]|uniref:Palmitoyltransferase n=1 Tax=Spiromyces aspiralis TaxID=68401 RepID=A0ACC1HSK4_9FUNG|nr:palmitoyltransferase [Spiromyces aspiralis]